MNYMTLLLLHDITFHSRWSQPGSASSGPAPAPSTSPARQCQLPPRESRGDPSMLLGKLCAALHAGPDAYNKAAAAWRAKLPLAALPDPLKDFRSSSSVRGAADEPNACGAPPTFPGHLPSTWQGGFAQTYHMTREIECWM